MAESVQYRLYTMCMIQDGNRVLLVNRPDGKGFPGYLAPGGKVEFPESIADGAVREAEEETGLKVSGLVFKGLDEFCDTHQGLRYMVFNYLATSFEGELLAHPPEGELVWVEIGQALELPMQPWFKRRFPLFFEPGTFELSFVRDGSTNETLGATMRHYGRETQPI
ncbi:8-oxo-dGTP diphosphatase [Paenibacillus sp. MWE-103]|uniref:8-oxo-dGTP diphosphatase n=1 Tax=Paenibacillus artemisiicola TaxID=1172618 RepID=A0ABS3W303_9BACL|nr:8-oxo-dGTP diphosphatase [Paenibacillus artemisiicola]MBO7742686.1 8-oxo-dGTP diphosphatase [Paenibacillus artemisiicola]